MARTKVMKLWTAIVTAFLALCTTLGLITTAAAAAVPQTEAASESVAQVTTPPIPWAWSRSLPPTMKQRIHAEAHGKSPSCRHRPSADTVEDTALEAASLCDPAEPVTTLQR
ncbi:DUF6344 domain-containing protein [Streptomyces sp. GESEQ-35]|uniref:DUF6344 domain-containing protein n=1 Tax=Streptomyces sp. GESEQ-35 TaxID=2812657 RepID=UPI001B332BF8|nr:DUF6344 domain-containing protein [Streptomyces sp. GESEQ-35]